MILSSPIVHFKPTMRTDISLLKIMRFSVPIYENSLFVEASGAETHVDLYRIVPECELKFGYINVVDQEVKLRRF